MPYKAFLFSSSQAATAVIAPSSSCSSSAKSAISPQNGNEESTKLLNYNVNDMLQEANLGHAQVFLLLGIEEEGSGP